MGEGHNASRAGYERHGGFLHHNIKQEVTIDVCDVRGTTVAIPVSHMSA